MFKELLDALRLAHPAGSAPIPSGTTLVPCELFEPHGPDSQRAGIVAETLPSLVGYIQRFNSDNTLIFASESLDRIHAAFDWHGAESTGWGEHTATLQLRPTPEWLAWCRVNGRAIGQSEFIEFIEEHLEAIKEPSAAEVLTIATRIQGLRKVRFVSALNTANGDVDLQYEENTDASTAGNVKVPSRLKLQIPIFVGAEEATTFEVTALFRYRVGETGKLHFEIKMLHTENILHEAFQSLLTEFRTQLKDAIGENAPQIIEGHVDKLPRAIINNNIQTAR